jgi:hypothetical protein
MRVPAWVFWFSLLQGGCASPLAQGVAEYEAGRVTSALRRLQHLGAFVPRLPPGEHARYALYRGLSHLTLGDAVRAERWLMPLKHAVDREPSLLDLSDRTRLFAALDAMGHLPGD